MNSATVEPNDEIPEVEIIFIREAARFLEQPSLLMNIAANVGKPVEWLLAKAPKQVRDVTQQAVRSGMDWAANTIPSTVNRDTLIEAYQAAGWNGFFHQLGAGAAGAVGGVFGLPGLAIELPITTGIMLRSIASIAQELGADLNDSGVRLECLSIFSYGGPGHSDDAMESSFYTARAAMAHLIAHAAAYVAGKGPAAIAAGVADGSAAALVKLLARIAAEFEVAVSEKFVAQSLPLIGAVTGASINAAFCGYFNSVARYLFKIKRLEERYGEAKVRAAYEAERAAI